MKIGKPTLKDLDEILNLWKGQYVYHNKLDPKYYISIEEKPLEIFKNYLENAIEKDEPNILIHKNENKIVGFITFEISEADYFDTNIKKYGEVVELFVHESYRKKGIGNKLLTKAEEYFKSIGIKWVELQVSSYNKNALEMYQHIGYKHRQSLLFKEI